MNCSTEKNTLRILALVAGLAISTLSSASQVTPFRQAQLKPPILDNIYNYQPLINTTHSFHNSRSSENDNIFIPKGEPNSLPMGHQNTSLARAHPLVRYNGIGFTGYLPPDPDMAVGPGHIVAVVNTAFAFFDKSTGQKLAQQDFSTFFSSQIKGDLISDPIVFFDRSSQRFFMSILDEGDTAKVSNELIAVSQSSNPMGNWFKYSINDVLTTGGNTFWLDYPHFGFNKDAIAFAGNMFSFDQTAYGGAQIVVIPKSQFVSGGTPTAMFFRLPDSPTVQPSRVYDNSLSTLYAITTNNTSQLTVAAFTGIDGSTGAKPLMSTTNVTIPAFIQADNDAVAPAGHTIDTHGSRLYSCHWRNGHMVTGHSVQTASGRIAARWYDVATNNYPSGQPSLIQSGDISGNTFDNYCPALTINARGDIGVVYSRSSETLPPQMLFASRYATDPPGVMGKPQLVASTVGDTYGFPGSNRWGDYFGIDTDPNDDVTFWVFAMAGTADRFWTTYIASFFVDLFQENSHAQSITKMEGGATSGSLASTYFSDTLYFNIASAQVPQVGQVASATVVFQPSFPKGTVQNVHVDYQMGAATGVSTLIYMYNWANKNWDYMSASPNTNTDSSGSLRLSLDQYTKYTNSTGQLKMLFRAISPQHLTSGAQPFTLRINNLQLTREEF
jgi:hypothetical protein